MKKIIFLFCFLIISFVILYAQSTKSYDIETIYNVENVVRGTMAINRMGNFEEITSLLLPINLETGRYRVTVTRRDSNIYEINGHNMYIKTRYCYEYAYNQVVVLEITSRGGYSFGKIHF